MISADEVGHLLLSRSVDVCAATLYVEWQPGVNGDDGPDLPAAQYRGSRTGTEPAETSSPSDLSRVFTTCRFERYYPSAERLVLDVNFEEDEKQSAGAWWTTCKTDSHSPEGLGPVKGKLADTYHHESVPFPPIVSRRLYQQVAERIKRHIHSGAMAAGDRLPSEKELALQLGVSRPTVREALIALEIAGLVEIRTGSGSYIRNSNKVVPATLDVGPSPLELLHARLLIEGEVAAEAAVRATQRDLEAIEGALEDMRRIMEAGEHAHAADQSFHVLIAAASTNRVLADLVSNLWQGMFSPIFYKLSERTGLLANQERAFAEHKAILAALQTHDPIGARAAMRCHLKSVEKVLMKPSHANSHG